MDFLVMARWGEFLSVHSCACEEASLRCWTGRAPLIAHGGECVRWLHKKVKGIENKKNRRRPTRSIYFYFIFFIHSPAMGMNQMNAVLLLAYRYYQMLLPLMTTLSALALVCWKLDRCNQPTRFFSSFHTARRSLTQLVARTRPSTPVKRIQILDQNIFQEETCAWTLLKKKTTSSGGSK